MGKGSPPLPFNVRKAQKLNFFSSNASSVCGMMRGESVVLVENSSSQLPYDTQFLLIYYYSLTPVKE